MLYLISENESIVHKIVHQVYIDVSLLIDTASSQTTCSPDTAFPMRVYLAWHMY